MQKTAMVPSTPIAFHRVVSPDSSATAPAASGGLRRECRPIMNSATSSGVAIQEAGDGENQNERASSARSNLIRQSPDAAETDRGADGGEVERGPGRPSWSGVLDVVPGHRSRIRHRPREAVTYPGKLCQRLRYSEVPRLDRQGFPDTSGCGYTRDLCQRNERGGYDRRPTESLSSRPHWRILRWSGLRELPCPG